MIKNNVNINNKNNKKKMMMMNDDGGGGGGGGAKTNMEDIGHVNMRENPTKKKSSTWQLKNVREAAAAAADKEEDFFFFFVNVEPHQGRALQTQPWGVNPRYTTPPSKTMYQVIQRNF